MEADAAYRAVRSRDRRFEGRFVVAVRTTRVYCRPGCPAPIPRFENVRFYACAAAAEAEGFRACLRCRPDAAPGSPAWRGAEATVGRALRLIDDGGLDGEDGVDELAERLGVSGRHLRRLFSEHVGASPLQVALTRRSHFARKLLDETSLSITEVASSSGFASLRRFQSAVRRAFGRAPRQLRQKGGAATEKLLLRLPLRPPYDWQQVAGFLAARAVPGLERVDERGYVRASEHGRLRVFPLDERALGLELPASSARGLDRLAARVRRVFDLDADPREIAAVLSADRVLAKCTRARPGLRVPGAWDGFELAVRAIVGQQVSVAGAVTLLGRLVKNFGEPSGEAGVSHLFPTAARLRRQDPARFGVPRARGRALVELAARIDDGALQLDGSAPLDQTLAALREIPGVGPWTAAYVAMRALGEPDAFPVGDLGLMRALGVSARELEERAEAWRPFRAYAAMHLWTMEAV